MPIYEIELPDGRVMEAEAPDEATAFAGAQQWFAANPPAPPAPAQAYKGDGSEEAAAYSDPRAMGHVPPAEDANAADVAAKVGQGFFANWGDELAATAGALPNMITGGRWGRDRATILAELREREKKLEAEHPGLAMAAELGGAGLSALATGAGAVRAAGAAPTVTRSALASGATAAPLGALDSTGRIEGPADARTYMGEAGEGAALAGGIGALVGGGGAALGRALNPVATREAEALTRQGVQLTPGEVVGPGVLSKFEDVAAGVPGIGNLIRARADEGMRSLNQAAAGEVAAPIGRHAARFARAAEPGHDSIQRMDALFNRRYGTITPRLSAQVDPQLTAEIGQITRNLPHNVRPEFDELVERYVTNLVDPSTGRLPGEQVHAALQGLREMRKRFRRSTANPYHSDVADALGSLRESLMQSAQRHSNPRDVQAFRNVQQAYSRYRPVRDAARRVSSDGGVFSPAILHSAVTGMDDSIGKGASARGRATMQHLSGPARSVMKPKGAGSPTAERMGWFGAGTAGAGVLSGAVEPSTAAALLLAGIPPAMLYSRAGTRAFQRYATGPRRAARESASRRSTRIAPGIGLLAEREWNADLSQ